MKIVFDTNILISAFLTTSGPSEYVFKLGLKRHTVILSEYIIKEFVEKLSEKFQIPHEKIDTAVRFLRNRAVVVQVPANPHLKFSDKKDIPILALLETMNPHYFVTGDKKLLEIKKRGGTLFLSLREAMNILEQSS